MNSQDCSDYLWDAVKNEFVCQSTVGQHHTQTLLLAFLVFFGVFFGLAIIIGIDQIIDLLKGLQVVVGLKISQVSKGKLMPITGVKVGGQGTFAETPLPVGSVLPAGVVPVWSTTDSNVTLTPSADGTSVVAAVAQGDTNTSFPLTVTATLADGSTPTGTVTVPILPQEPTSFQIDQTA